MGETLKWSYIPMDWATIDGGWWQQVFSRGTMISHDIETVCFVG